MEGFGVAQVIVEGVRRLNLPGLEFKVILPCAVELIRQFASGTLGAEADTNGVKKYVFPASKSSQSKLTLTSPVLLPSNRLLADGEIVLPFASAAVKAASNAV